IAVPPAATQIIPVRVTNLGRLPWDSAGDPPFFLSYHWLKADGTGIVSFEGVRTPFPAPVAAGAIASIDAVVWTPPRSGQYRLEWDLVQQGRLWFNTEPDAVAPAVTEAMVSGAPSDAASLRTFPLPRRTVRPGRLVLW